MGEACDTTIPMTLSMKPKADTINKKTDRFNDKKNFFLKPLYNKNSIKKKKHQTERIICGKYDIGLTYRLINIY